MFTRPNGQLGLSVLRPAVTKACYNFGPFAKGTLLKSITICFVPDTGMPANSTSFRLAFGCGAEEVPADARPAGEASMTGPEVFPSDRFEKSLIRVPAGMCGPVEGVGVSNVGEDQLTLSQPGGLGYTKVLNMVCDGTAFRFLSVLVAQDFGFDTYVTFTLDAELSKGK